MERLNVVTGVDRERNGRVIRLCVGVANLGNSSWLSRPVTIGAEYVIKRIKAGETFRTVLNGVVGPSLGVVRETDGAESIIPIDEQAHLVVVRFEDLPPC